MLTGEVPFKGMEGVQVAWLVVAKEEVNKKYFKIFIVAVFLCIIYFTERKINFPLSSEYLKGWSFETEINKFFWVKILEAHYTFNLSIGVRKIAEVMLAERSESMSRIIV